ncbi:hypothetical protein H6F96_21035 [Microcoleus sp. FACHB-53]|nr:hypothetical protein [Microcoleus sp. FACHB-53]
MSCPYPVVYATVAAGIVPKQRVLNQIASLELDAIASINPQISKAKLE